MLGAMLSGLSFNGWAQHRDYPSYSQLTARLMKIGSRYPNLCSVNTIGKTATGKEVWLLTLGRDNAENKPALVIAAGVEATQLATVELSLQMTEQLLQAAMVQDSVRQLLQTKTIYIFPNLNPDATEQYSEKLRWERSGNAQPMDDDRDGRIFEDPFEDLNRDGLITMMRVKDPTGPYRPSKLDPRVMVKADAAKGEKGGYLLLTEGIDNDKDGKWNEDPEGGVVFNKNFSFDFPYFQVGAGEHPMSERETKAFADFLFDAKNVYAVFVLGPTNNLSEPLKFDRSNVSKRIITGLLEKDAAVNSQVSKLYNATTQLKDAPKTQPTGGDVLQWAYFHYGRYSYSTPGWWIPKQPLPKDSTYTSQTYPEEDHEDLNFLRWAKANNVVGTFVNWTPIQHPDFPGQTVEVGGLAPYVKQTPPKHLLEPVTRQHLKFFMAYAELMPRLEIVNIKTEKVTGGLTRITAEVLNNGSLPTHSEIGDRTRWVQKVKVNLRLEKDQTLVSGPKMHLHNAIAGGDKVTVSWLVKGKGYVGVVASSPTAGTQTKEVVLR